MVFSEGAEIFMTRVASSSFTLRSSRAASLSYPIMVHSGSKTLHISLGYLNVRLKVSDRLQDFSAEFSFSKRAIFEGGFGRSVFFIFYMAVSQSTLGQCRESSLTKSMSITAFTYFHLKVIESLVTRLSLKARLST